MISDSDELRSLYQDAAEYLVGGPVLVRFRLPRSVGASGSAYRSRHNFFVIDLAPNEKGFYRFKTFFHEVGHLIFDEFKPGDYYLEPSGSKVVDYGQEYQESIDERLANAFSDLLFEWSFERYMENVRPGDNQEMAVAYMLRDLKNYPIRENKELWRV